MMINIPAQSEQYSLSTPQALFYIFISVMFMVLCLFGFVRLFQSQLG